MNIAMFQTPLIRPERSARQVFDWTVQQAITADQAGFTEYWVGEHATQSWESVPSPELVIAAAARETENLVFAPGAHLLPYHHPATLAIQTAWLSQVLEGRYILGVGAGAYPGDAAIRGITDMSKNHLMVMEALEIMQKVWKGEPFHFEGKFWNAGFPEEDPSHPFRDVRPYGGTMPIGMTGLSKGSPSITFAGKNGWLPVTVYGGVEAQRSHWEVYEQAATENGHPADRQNHHVVRDVIVAETDEEAKKLAVEGGIGFAWTEYLLPVYKQFGIINGLMKDPNDDPLAIDVDYLAEHVWLIGSPDTVVRKIEEWKDEAGEFGTLMIYSHDYIDNPEPWNESMRLLVDEVAPRVSSGAGAGAAA